LLYAGTKEPVEASSHDFYLLDQVHLAHAAASLSAVERNVGIPIDLVQLFRDGHSSCYFAYVQERIAGTVPTSTALILWRRKRRSSAPAPLQASLPMTPGAVRDAWLLAE
jgi:hypothetical protein